MRMVIKQDGKRRAFGPFLIKLRQLAIAVVPKRKVHPKNGFLPRRGISSSQGLHVVQSLILCAGRRAEQERFFPSNGLPTAPEEFIAFKSARKAPTLLLHAPVLGGALVAGQ